MRRWGFFSLLAFVLIVPAACRRQAAPEKSTETRETAESAGEPETAAAALDKIRSLRPSEEDTEETVAKRLTDMLALLEQMEKKFPKAVELHEARMDGLMAANYLARMKNDPALAARAVAIASAIVASDAPAEMKVSADARVLLLKIDPVAPSATRPAAEIEESIRQFVERYADSDAAEPSLMMGAALAKMAALPDLADGLEEAIVKGYPESAMGRRLREIRSWRGKTFRAELTRLDGSKLSLPADLLGKVVVVDFWASWCTPCVEDIPHMKALYARYKAKGVEFVGISLDRPGQKAELAEFVRTQKMNWVHAYSGQFWDDPTARAYGVGGIPRLWVLGKDGRVASADARGMLAAVIDRALEAPATRPAAGPAAPAK